MNAWRRKPFLLSRLEREVQTLALPTSPAKAELVDEASVALLPALVQRYLRFMRVVGRPRDWSLRAEFSAHFRRDAGDWLECQVLQYDRRQPVARLFLMQLSLHHLLPVTVRDNYVRGHVTLRDSSLSVTARVWLDERGAPTDFSTTDRFFDTKDGRRVRTEWRTPVNGWQDADGRRLPTRARAVWQLPSGPFAYADFRMDPAKITFNVPPI